MFIFLLNFFFQYIIAWSRSFPVKALMEALINSVRRALRKIVANTFGSVEEDEVYTQFPKSKNITDLMSQQSCE